MQSLRVAQSSRSALPSRRCSTPLPVAAPLRRSHNSTACRAENEPGKATSSTEAPPAPAAPPAAPTPAAPEKPSNPLILQEGQGTAIWTGAISLIFGFGYLFLVQLMDGRGNELLPPPPEAFL